jgi:hypothetical protein
MRSFFQQFAHPEGPLGWLVGHLMAWKNGARSRFALELLGARTGERVLEIRRVLRAGGRAVVVVQPMWKGATPSDAQDWSSRLRASMRRAGLVEVTHAELELRPVLTVAAVGRSA